MNKKYVVTSLLVFFAIILFYVIFKGFKNKTNIYNNAETTYSEIITETTTNHLIKTTEYVDDEKLYSNIDEITDYTISNEKEIICDEKLIGQNNLIEIRNISLDKALEYNIYEYTYIENQEKVNDNIFTQDKKISYLQLKYKKKNLNENAINNALKAHLQVLFSLPNYNIYDRRGFAYSRYGKINNNIISYCTLYELDNPNGGNEELITTNIYLNYDALKNFQAIHLQLSDFIDDFNSLAKYYLENKCSFYNPENSYTEDIFEKYNPDKEINQRNIENLSEMLKSNKVKWFITKDNELVVFFLYMDIFNAGYSVKLDDIKEILTPNAFKLLSNEKFNIIESN